MPDVAQSQTVSTYPIKIKPTFGSCGVYHPDSDPVITEEEKKFRCRSRSSDTEEEEENQVQQYGRKRNTEPSILSVSRPSSGHTTPVGRQRSHYSAVLTQTTGQQCAFQDLDQDTKKVQIQRFSAFQGLSSGHTTPVGRQRAVPTPLY